MVVTFLLGLVAAWHHDFGPNEASILNRMVLGSVAELERSLIGERVKAGLRNAKANGVRLGRPSLREISAAEIQQLRRDRRKSGESFKALAQRYGISVWTAFHLCKSKA